MTVFIIVVFFFLFLRNFCPYSTGLNAFIVPSRFVPKEICFKENNPLNIIYFLNVDNNLNNSDSETNI